MRVLVTGGEGFIGRHLVRALVDRGYGVRTLDLMVAQVHGEAPGGVAEPAGDGVERIVGDVADPGTVRRALEGVDAVFHQAAEVGVGQSMYEMERYVRANTLGTAVLLRAVVDLDNRLRKLVVASSMSIYGEGAYRCDGCGERSAPMARTVDQLVARRWDPDCPHCGRADLTAVATPEDKPLHPSSVYAITKQDQEQLCLNVGRAYGVPTVALRYFNVYGEGQALANPYTGVCAIFSARLLNGQPPLIFEDGAQSRDFVHVSDIVAANLAALDTDSRPPTGVNIGSGRPTTVLQVAQMLSDGLGVACQPQIVGQYREGDVRHCFADITLARSVLGYEPAVAMSEGMPELVAWVGRQVTDDGTPRALAELSSRRLVW